MPPEPLADAGSGDSIARCGGSVCNKLGVRPLTASSGVSSGLASYMEAVLECDAQG